MPQFIVHVAESGGRTRRLTVVAADAAAVAGEIGVAPARVLRVKAVAESPDAAVVRLRRTGGEVDVRLFAQELAVLLDAGVPLLEGLQTLCEKDEGRAGMALAPVVESVRQGRSFSASLAASPAFDELTVALVAASERSGLLATALRHHAAYLSWSERLRAQLVAAAIYPCLLLLSGIGVVAFLVMFVLPRFAGLFEGAEASLPAASRWLIQWGSAAATHPWALLLVLALLGLAVALVSRQPGVWVALQRGAWQLPAIGPRLRTLALARLYRCVGLLAQSGVPIPEALRLAEKVLADALRPALREAARAVLAGERLSAAWHVCGLLTPVALRMVRVGESSGDLGGMLERAAAFHDEELTRLSELVTKAINPLLMLVMGGVIGGIVVLMYLPIFTLMERVQ